MIEGYGETLNPKALNPHIPKPPNFEPFRGFNMFTFGVLVGHYCLGFSV